MNPFARPSRKWILPAVLAFGFLVRASGLFWGIGLFPSERGFYHPDEPKIVRYVLNFPASFGEQTDFRYPLGLHHVLSLGYWPLKKAAEFPGMEFWAPESISALQWTYLVCRMGVIILGTLSAYLVYRVVRRSTDSEGAACIAALFLSLLPYPVQNSALVTTDVPLSLASIAAVYAFLMVDSQPRPGALAWGLLGALAGAAVGIKYTGVYLIAALGVLLIWRYVREKRPLPEWVLGGGSLTVGAAAAFVITTPQFVMSPSLIAHGLFSEMERVGTLHWSAAAYVRSFWTALGIPGALAALAALGILLRKPSRHAAIVSVFLACFLLLTVKGLQARYVITIAPLIAVLVGLAWAHVHHRLPRAAFAAMLVPCAALLFSCLYARYAWDTRSETARFVQSRYPAGTSVHMAVIAATRNRERWREPKFDKSLHPEVRLNRKPDLIIATSPPQELLLAPNAVAEWYSRHELGAPRTEMADLYARLASPQSEYRLVWRVRPTRLPVEFAGFPLAVYEKIAP